MKKLLVAAAACVAQVCLVSVCSAATIHIETTGDDGNDGSEGSPVLTLARAVALAQEDDTILFGDGEFEEPAVQVTIDKNLTITSKNGPDQTTFRSLHRGVVGNSSDHSGWIYFTNCPRTLVSGLTFNGKWPDGSQPTIRTAVYLAEFCGATISNCVFRNLKGGVRYGNSSNADWCAAGMGPAAFMYGGTIVDSRFEENCANRSYPRGGAVSMGDRGCTDTPTIDRCTFVGNWCEKIAGNNTSLGGAIWVSNGAIVRNSLFKGNRSDNGTLGAIGYTWYAYSPCLIVNCTAVSNSCSSANQTSERTWPTNNKVLFDSLAWGNYSAGFIEDTADPGFVDAIGGDYHLAPGSAAIDSSVNTTYDKGTLDLDGNPRVMGLKADKGCYEFDPNQFAVGISYKKFAEFAPTDVEFTATANGGELDPDACYWTFDGSEPSAANHDAVGAVVTNNLAPGRYTVRFATTHEGKTYAVDKADFVSLLGHRLYVKKDNPNAKYPYADWETASATYDDAMALLKAGQESVTIDDGEYTARYGYTIPANVTVSSVNGPGKTVLDYANAAGAFTLSAGDTVTGLTLRRAKGGYSSGGITMTAAALVTNCVIDSASCLGNYGSALYATAGTIVDCVITNCSNNADAASGYPIAVSLTGTALMDRCLVVGSHLASDFTARSGGAIHVGTTQGGTVRNTLVTGSEMNGCAGIYVGKNGRVENCTIAGNTVKGAAPDGTSTALFIADLTGAVVNTLVAENRNRIHETVAFGGVDGWESCVSACFSDETDGDPKFADAANGDYTLQAGSPCVNTAETLDWMAGAKDLAGNPRVDVYDQVPDIGCYEYTESSEVSIALAHTQIGESEFAPQLNEFVATISPRSATYDPEECYWTFDGSEPSAANHDAVGTTVTYAVAAGDVTVRFKATVNGEPYEVVKENWFTVQSEFVYLVQSGSTPQAPYLSWATAATTLDAALAALQPGMTLLVSNGTYEANLNTVAANFHLPMNVTIRSVNGPDTVTFTYGYNTRNIGAFVLDYPGCTLDGLRIYRTYGMALGAVQMTAAGLVTNCVFDTCRCRTGAAVEVGAGLVVDCVFKDCLGGEYGGTYALAAAATGSGVIDRCRITGLERNAYDSRGAVSAGKYPIGTGTSGEAGGTVRNCLISGYTTSGCSGIYVGKGGAAENCTVVNCVSKPPASGQTACPVAVYAADPEASVVNVLAAGNTLKDGTPANRGGAEGTDDCFVTSQFHDDVETAKFADAATGDYTLQAGSPCVNAGTKLGWMTEDALDLAHHARIRKDGTDRPDVGCYEYWESDEIKVVLHKKQLTEGVYAPQRYEFSAVISPSTLEYDPENCWWTFDGSEPTAANHAATGVTVTNVFAAATNPTHTVRFVISARGETVGVEQKDWVTALQDRIYLVKENPNAAVPYATPETAATNANEAIAFLTASNMTLYVGAGTYAVSRSVTLLEGSRIVAAEGPERTVFDYKASKATGVVALKAKGARLEGLRIRGTGGSSAKSAPNWDCGVNVTADGAMVTNCVFDGCATRGNGGACLRARAGLVVDCDFIDAESCSTFNAVAVTISGSAVMDRCRITGARTIDQNMANAGAVSVGGKKDGNGNWMGDIPRGGTVRNCLVAGNRLCGCSGICVSLCEGSLGTVENCTVASNVTLRIKESQAVDPHYVDTSAGLVLGDASGQVVNTIAAFNVTEEGDSADATVSTGAELSNCFIGGDPLFKNPARMNFHLRQSSPCVDRSTILPWMADATDLDGNPRLTRDGTVDIGCYQASRNGLLLLVR